MELPGQAVHPTQSFILRIWIEEPSRPGRAATWRGRVTDVQTQEDRVVESFAGVLRFLVEQLLAVGVRLRAGDRVRMVFVRTGRR